MTWKNDPENDPKNDPESDPEKWPWKMTLKNDPINDPEDNPKTTLKNNVQIILNMTLNWLNFDFSQAHKYNLDRALGNPFNPHSALQ